MRARFAAFCRNLILAALLVMLSVMRAPWFYSSEDVANVLLTFVERLRDVSAVSETWIMTRVEKLVGLESVNMADVA